MPTESRNIPDVTEVEIIAEPLPVYVLGQIDPWSGRRGASRWAGGTREPQLGAQEMGEIDKS